MMKIAISTADVHRLPQESDKLLSTFRNEPTTLDYVLESYEGEEGDKYKT
jgi:hypothetical protein